MPGTWRDTGHKALCPVSQQAPRDTVLKRCRGAASIAQPSPHISHLGTIGPMVTDFCKLFSRAYHTDIHSSSLYKNFQKYCPSWSVSHGMGRVAGWKESRDWRGRGMEGVARWEGSRNGRGRVRVGRYLPPRETQTVLKRFPVARPSPSPSPSPSSTLPPL